VCKYQGGISFHFDFNLSPVSIARFTSKVNLVKEFIHVLPSVFIKIRRILTELLDALHRGVDRALRPQFLLFLDSLERKQNPCIFLRIAENYFINAVQLIIKREKKYNLFFKISFPGPSRKNNSLVYSELNVNIFYTRNEKLKVFKTEASIAYV
jgi:hypothetical protein